MERFGDVQWIEETCKPGLRKDMNQGSFRDPNSRKEWSTWAGHLP